MDLLRVRLLPDPVLHPDVLWIDQAQGAVWLINLSRNACVIDAETASVLRAIIAGGISGGVRVLEDQYGLSHEAATGEIVAFCAKLRRNHMLRPRSGMRLRSWWTGIRRVCLIALLRSLGSKKVSAPLRVQSLLWLSHFGSAWLGWAITRDAFQEAFIVSPPQPDKRHDPTFRISAVEAMIYAGARRTPFRSECKERSLTALASLRSAGLPARIHIGVATMPLRAHVWTEVDGRVVADTAENCAPFAQVHSVTSPVLG